MFKTASDRDFTKNFLISFGVHLGLFFIAFFGGGALMKALNVNDNVEIIRSSVRVDVVGMPKLTIQELKALQANMVTSQAKPVETKGAESELKPKSDEAEDVIKKDDLVIQEEGKKKKASFLNIISDYSKKKVDAKEAKKGKKSGTNQNLDTLVLEGNRLSKGAALVGDYSDSENSEFASYVQGLPEAVRPHWKLPSYLQDQTLRCRIKIYLSNSGNLISSEIYESSGQPEYDARALKAVKDASPFPAPSSGVGQRLTKSGIILGFPL